MCMRKEKEVNAQKEKKEDIYIHIMGRGVPMIIDEIWKVATIQNILIEKSRKNTPINVSLLPV